MNGRIKGVEHSECQRRIARNLDGVARLRNAKEDLPREWTHQEIW